MVSVSPETWDLLRLTHRGGAFAQDFERAWSNGRAFLAATDGLRGRKPISVEWKGSHRAPGDEVAPIDLRIDHVFLVSCKYMSRIMINASPSYLFDRLLQGGHGTRGGNWYSDVAAAEYQRLYEVVVDTLGWSKYPRRVTELDHEEQRQLAQAIRSAWPGDSLTDYLRLAEAVARVTSQRWSASLSHGSPPEAMLWRVLRMGSAPYFVLGASPTGPIQLRVATPWDWRLRYRLQQFHCSAEVGGQPRVAWTATIADRHSGAVSVVRGHVEVRWSHGRFVGNPEAKVYLDSAHLDVPGYFPLR